MVSSASFLRRSRLSTFVSEAPATPPPPNLEPTRFCEVLSDIGWPKTRPFTNLKIWEEMDQGRNRSKQCKLLTHFTREREFEEC